MTELDGSFADAILALFRDEPLRRTIAAEARRTAEERFSRTRFAGEFARDEQTPTIPPPLDRR